MKIFAQLAFDGVCQQAFSRYAEVLGGHIVVMNTFGGSNEALPPGSEASRPDHVRFAMLELEGGALLGNDVPPHRHLPMQGFNVALHLSSVDEAERIFSALSQGGEVSTPLSKVEWADRFGMLRDRFGTPWLLLAMASGSARSSA